MTLALDGQAHGHTGASASFTCTLTTTAAGKVYVSIVSNGSPIISVVGATLGSFTKRVSFNSDATSGWCIDSPGALTNEVITITQSSGAFCTAEAFGIATATGFDGNASIPANGTSSISISTNTAVAFVIEFGRGSGLGPDTGFAQIDNLDFLFSGYKLMSVTQSGLSLTFAGGATNGICADALVVAAASSFNPGWASGATKTIGAAF